MFRSGENWSVLIYELYRRLYLQVGLTINLSEIYMCTFKLSSMYVKLTILDAGHLR